MIKKFVEIWDKRKDEVRSSFTDRDKSYSDIVKSVITMLSHEDDYGDSYDFSETPDPDRIVEIDHGDYQGTLLFIIGAKGYQPITYWSCFVDYGSCSGCDTLEALWEHGYDDDGNETKLSQKEVDGLMTLALHILQSIKLIGYEDGED